MRVPVKKFVKSALSRLPHARRYFDRVASVRAERDKLVDRCRELEIERQISDTKLVELKANLVQLLESRAALEVQLGKKATELHMYGNEPPFVPNGHFYSPVPSRDEILRDQARLYPQHVSMPLDIDFRTHEQIELLRTLAPLVADMPFKDEPADGLRYGYQNTAYSYGDAICLHGMLRHLKPARVVEVGSGHSSCMTLDTVDRWLGGTVACTFIEPYPELLYSLLKTEDRERITILPQRVQDIQLEVFEALQANDVLFIDSTHVSKAGSDVNTLFFDVLPRLAAGVYIHIHDIFYPFEYPSWWVVDEGRAWNELYVLRALLQNSDGYEIVLFNSYLAKEHESELARCMPLALRNVGGSLWLRKTR